MQISVGFYLIGLETKFKRVGLRISIIFNHVRLALKANNVKLPLRILSWRSFFTRKIRRLSQRFAQDSHKIPLQVFISWLAFLSINSILKRSEKDTNLHNFRN